MTLRDEFIVAFEVWEEAQPYLHLIVDEQEMQLVVAMQGEAITVDRAADLMAMDAEEAAIFLQRCYARHILNKDIVHGHPTYTAANFGAQLDHFAKFENWDDIPPNDRQTINRRFLDEFIAQHRPAVEQAMGKTSNEPCDRIGETHKLPNDTVMLLSEIEAMIDAATHVVVQPCDCRRLGQNCNRPVETCIWMDEGALKALDRGHGRRITKEEAKALVRWADKKGLMHTADSEWQTRGLHAICNCCACDCYPFRAALELGSKGTWPKSRYLAAYDRGKCNLCGACVKRCHFDAFHHDDTILDMDGKARKNVVFDADKCWGCGLCANTCPTEAIIMERLGI